MNSLYRSIQEVDGSAVPRRSWKQTRIVGWQELALELMLRLECTPKTKWLRMEFRDETELTRGYASLCQWFGKFGVSVTMRRATKNGTAFLFVRRGPDYKK